MSSAELARWGALGAFLAGISWIVSGLISLAIPGQGTEEIGSSSYYLLETMFCIASVGMLGGLAGLHARQAPSYRALGAAGFYAAFIGIALILVSTVATILVGREVLDWLFVLGCLGTSVGLFLLGAATLRAGVLPRWCGTLLIVAVFGIPVYFALGNYGGAIFTASCGWYWVTRAGRRGAHRRSNLRACARQSHRLALLRILVQTTDYWCRTDVWCRLRAENRAELLVQGFGLHQKEAWYSSLGAKID